MPKLTALIDTALANGYSVVFDPYETDDGNAGIKIELLADDGTHSMMIVNDTYEWKHRVAILARLVKEAPKKITSPENILPFPSERMNEP